MDHYLPYQGFGDTHTQSLTLVCRYAHVHAHTGYQPENEDKICVCADTLTHKAGFEPLCTGMLMFSKETITQQRERQRD